MIVVIVIYLTQHPRVYYLPVKNVPERLDLSPGSRAGMQGWYAGLAVVNTFYQLMTVGDSFYQLLTEGDTFYQLLTVGDTLYPMLTVREKHFISC